MLIYFSALKKKKKKDAVLHLNWNKRTVFELTCCLEIPREHFMQRWAQ